METYTERSHLQVYFPSEVFPFGSINGGYEFFWGKPITRNSRLKKQFFQLTQEFLFVGALETAKDKKKRDRFRKTTKLL